MEISAKVFMKDIVLWQHFGRSENINSSEKRDTREVNKYHLMMLMLHIFYLKGDLIIKSEENGARTNIFPQFTYWVAKYAIHMLSGQIWNRINLIFVLEMICSHFSFWISTQFRQVRYFLLVGAGSKLRFRVDAKFKTGRIRKLLKFATLTSATSGHMG